MAANLKSCGQDEGIDALKRGVNVLLSGVNASREGLLPVARDAAEHERHWRRFLERDLEAIKRVVFASYQGATAMRLEDVLASSQSALAEVQCPERVAAASRLAREVLASSEGARHERLLVRLARAWGETEETACHPAVSVAVKAAVFREPLPVAQVAYFFQEWRASGARFLEERPGRLETFLASQPADLVAVPSFALADYHRNSLQGS